MTNPIGLYIHVPFCAKKCPYCDFYSLKYNEEDAIQYVNAVIRNIQKYRDEKISLDSVYFGGGTPSLLTSDKLGRIMESISDSFVLLNSEISIEVNPSLVNVEKLHTLKEIGFNRISFGIQSFNDNELKALGRLHNSETAQAAVINAEKAGFSNISADIMLGINHQNLSSMYNTLDIVQFLPLTHISAYMLKIEENTPFNDEKIISVLPDDDAVSDLYLACVDRLSQMGFKQYEISNFSKCDFESRHNLHYWNCEEYIGIGPAAHSYFKGKRYCVPRSLKAFNESICQTEIITDDNSGTFEEYAMLKIRLMKGLDLSECEKRFGISIEKIIQKARPIENLGLISIKDNTISLNPKGCLVSNQIIGRLFVE
ncbi:MAG TPA: radical SAM family heme chaperone HemW [Oscillospiraceae bacterium]|nr:radical SAM family heme chaperone HemW [Oscillospiraceae bacterium]